MVKLVLDAVQQVRIKLRWNELDEENRKIAEARQQGKKYRPTELINEDTPKQLLARCRHSLSKPRYKWTLEQSLRMSIAFQRYPQLETAYNHAQRLIRFYFNTNIQSAKSEIEQWTEDTFKYKKEVFYRCAKSLYYHMETILNFFNNRSTNASAESFNAKIKLFRANHTKKRLPVKLVYYEEFNRIDEAFYREKQVQGWSRKKKEALITSQHDQLPKLSIAYRDLKKDKNENK